MSSEVQGYMAKVAVLEGRKERLKIEEIDAIQQQTIKEMKTLYQQSTISISDHRKDLACLDLGREIASLKVVLMESQQEALSKNLVIERLKVDLSKAEVNISEMIKKIKSFDTLPSLSELGSYSNENPIKSYCILKNEVPNSE